MANWLDKIQEVLSIKSIEDQMGKNSSLLGAEGSWGNAIGDMLQAPLYGVTKGVGAAGGAIGSVAGGIGGALSEAGQEAQARGDYASSDKAILEGIKSGAETGYDAAQENITALDLASLGAGAGAGLAMRGAGAASKLGNLGKAASLAKTAGNLGKADLALSGVDAGLGVNDVVTGVQEGDLAKTAMGVARVAGNTYGAKNAFNDLTSARGFRDAANELDDLISPNTDVAADVALREKAYRDKKLKSIRILDAPDGRKFSLDLHPKDTPIQNMRTERQLRAILQNPDRTAAFQEMAGIANRISDELKEPGGAYDELHKAIEWRYTRENNPDRVPLKIITEQRRPPKLESLKKRAGEFKGFFLGGGQKGFSYVSKGDSVLREKGVGNGYWINPTKIGEQVEGHFEFLTSEGNLLTPETIEKATYAYGPKVQNIINGIHDGSVVLTPEVAKTLKSEMFKRSLMYTILHEDLGHAAQDSLHSASRADKNPAYYEKVERDAGLDMRDSMNTPLNPKTLGTPGEEFDMFSIYQNRIFNEMNDPTRLSKVKAILDADGMEDQIAKWLDATKPLTPEELLQQSTPVLRQDRTVGTKELAAAEDEFATVMDEMPDDATKMAMTAEETDAIDAKNAKIQKEIDRKTKAGEKSGEKTVWEQPTPAAEPPRFGQAIDPALADEPLRPLAERIKMAFAEQRRINRINLEKNNEFWHAKMQVQEEAWAKYNNGEISEEELYRRIDEARKGSHGLITETLGMRLTPEEFKSVMATIQEQSVKNTEERNNLAISWKKMANGERLEPGEVENLRVALKTQVGEAKQNNFFLKMLKAGENLVGGSRALMSSMDLSAAGRQALYASVTNPKETARAFKAQIDALKMTPQQFETYMKTLSDPDHNPFAQLSKEAGLHITGPHQLEGKVEEAFLNPTWAEKIPGVRRTEQAYIAYLNKMRVELFNKGADTLMDAGIAWHTDTGELTQAYKDLAYMVNTLTGRGEMSLMHISPASRMGKKMGLVEELAPGEKKMNQMHRALTSVFFAPRFTASRAAILRDSTMAMLGGNLHPDVNKMYMKNVVGTYMAQLGVVSMLVGTGVATFQADPRKPDFGNLRVGNVRYDIFGGLKQWAKLFSVIGTDKYMSQTYGWREYGEGMGSKSKTGEVGKFLQGKLSPPAGFLLEALTGEDFLGRKSNMLKNAYGHMFPMILQTVGEVLEASEADQLAIAVPAASLGIGVNAYKPTTGGGWKR